MFSYPSILTYVLVALKNCLIETILLSTHNMVLLRNKKKFWYALLIKGLVMHLNLASIYFMCAFRRRKKKPSSLDNESNNGKNGFVKKPPRKTGQKVRISEDTESHA